MGVHNIKDKAEWDQAMKDAGDKIVVVDFFATWCGPCKVISPKVIEMSNDEAYADNVVFYKVDVDEVPDVSQEMGIRAMPTFKYFKHGHEFDQVVGASQGKIKETLDKALASAA